MTTISRSETETENQETIPKDTEVRTENKESISHLDQGANNSISATAITTTTIATIVVEPDLLKDFPEGGFGWLVVLASFVIYFWTFGLNSTFGVFQAHFLRIGAFNHATEAELSWVGSMAAGMVYLPGPFINTLIRHLGLYTLVIVGTLSCSLGFILASFATQLWQLYLTQGLLFGLGGGLVFLSTISMTSQYFNKRRGFANGIVVSGSGIGGLVLAPLTNLLISKMGVQWCQRILGFCMLACLVAIFPFLRPRVKTVKTGSVVDWSLFKIRGFAWLWAFSLVMPFGKVVRPWEHKKYDFCGKKKITDVSSSGQNPPPGCGSRRLHDPSLSDPNLQQFCSRSIASGGCPAHQYLCRRECGSPDCHGIRIGSRGEDKHSVCLLLHGRDGLVGDLVSCDQ